jgi:hypothetical protein
VCQRCSKRHPTPLHGDRQETKGDDKETKPTKENEKEARPVINANVSYSNTLNRSYLSSMIVPVWVSQRSNPDCERLFYALLDSQSDTTFITQEVCDQLAVQGTPTTLSISTMTSTKHLVRSSKVSGLTVRGLHGDTIIDLPPAFARESIPANREHIPTPEVARRWPHLSQIANELSPIQEADIGLLVGYNCPRALAPKEVVLPTQSSGDYQPTGG